jgi:hypothetical protein
MSKGSKRRQRISQEEYAKRHEVAFGRTEPMVKEFREELTEPKGIVDRSSIFYKIAKRHNEEVIKKCGLKKSIYEYEQENKNRQHEQGKQEFKDLRRTHKGI